MIRNSSLVHLMYHELGLPGRRMCHDEPGYTRYVVAESDFREQMRDLHTRALPGISVGEFLASSSPKGIVLTFDDGCETDLVAAAPLLRELSFHATFYITVGFLGLPGYLSRAQLRELADLGFEIGSHSLTHPYLNDLDESALRREIEVSKSELEQITGRPVLHFSCPGGRCDQRAMHSAKAAGYVSLATSETKANRPGGDTYALGRVAVLRGTSLPEFRRLSAGELWARRARETTRFWFRNLIGNSLYDRLRTRLLRPS
jgi:peptidoglycan/xylan/chitin deacetylase (PgdA/CDA1 family)